MMEECIGCGGRYEVVQGTIHKYMLSSTGCWHHYGKILAREYESPELFAKAHRYSVDAYALQHPGRIDDRRAYQSVRLHYISLHLIFEHGYSLAQATGILKTLAGMDFDPLPITKIAFTKTASDISNTNVLDHTEQVKLWAKSAYDSWGILKPFAADVISTRNIYV